MKLSLPDWLRFKDRDESPYNPVRHDLIVTNRFTSSTRSEKAHELGSRTEEWSITSALIPKRQLARAAEKLFDSDLSPGIGWYGTTRFGFSFGDVDRVHGIHIHAWVVTREDPTTGELIAELRQDFIRYHGLRVQAAGEFVHPIEQQVVCRMRTDEVEGYRPHAFVFVLPDYLRDYLAAKKMGMLISVVADRFAHAETEAELGIENRETAERIGDHTWHETIVHPPGWPHIDSWMGRGILRRNIVVEPYQKPKVARSPWPFHGEPPGRKHSAMFIVDTEGTRARIAEHGGPLYLYFRPEVLRKYLNTPGYDVYFHMRTWGVATSTTGDSVDVGINDAGLLTAFAPDLRKLGDVDQTYWASFSVLPSGGACQEMWQTRMMLAPPHSPNAIELIHEARQSLHDAFLAQFEVALYLQPKGEVHSASHISVGPVGSDNREFLDLAKVLYSSVMENMLIRNLRAAIENSREIDPKWRQIKLLTEVLVAQGLSADAAATLLRPIDALNRLRITEAHLTEEKYDSVFRDLGIGSVPATPRRKWNACLGAVVASLHRIADGIGKRSL